VLKPGKVTAPLHAADWMPTLTKLAGWGKGAEAKFDGMDVWPVLTGEAKESARTIYIPHPSGAVVLRDGWKLISRKAQGEKVELFNVSEDPSETKDLAAEKPEKVTELKDLLAELRKGDLTTLPADLKGTAE